MDEIDRLLADDEELIPRPELLAAVMEAVAREREPLPPLAFPWRGVVGGGLAAGIAGLATALALASPAAAGDAARLAAGLAWLCAVAGLCVATVLVPRLWLEG